MFTDRIRQAGRLFERLSGGNVGGADAVNTGDPGGVTVVSSEELELQDGGDAPGAHADEPGS